MFNKRSTHMLMVIAIVIVAAFAVREGLVGAETLSQGNTAKESRALECASLPSRYSIHTEIVEETGARLTFTEDGPTGIDGGLIDLLSSYRTCSR